MAIINVDFDVDQPVIIYTPQLSNNHKNSIIIKQKINYL
jgi:hypothetical protein